MITAQHDALHTAAISRRRFLKWTAGSVVTAGLAGAAWPAAAEELRLAARIQEAPASHPLAPALRLAAKALAAVEPIKDYEATFVKTELVAGKLLSTRMQLKFREQPRSVYLKFLDLHAGREVLFVEGANNGELLVKEVGIASLVGPVTLDPNGKYAMEENRYPITLIGIKILIETVLQQWLAETKLDQITVNIYPNARIGDAACMAVERTHAVRRENVKFGMTRLYLDAANNLPIRLQQFAFPERAGEMPTLVEDYSYLELKTNVGLTDLDFDSKNPKYAF